MPLVFKNIFTQKLKDISLEIADGEILTIFGPEGEGKDDIFKVITGEAAIKSGEIILDEKIVGSGKKDARYNLLYLHEFIDYIIYKRRMKRGLYTIAYKRWLKRVDDKKLDIVSEIIGIDRDFLLSPSPKHLSKGERKRFDLARYLITTRKVILLDDPLIGLDWPMCKTILANLKEIVKRFNQPCLYKANSERECEELKGRIVLIIKGQIEYSGDWKPGLNF